MRDELVVDKEYNISISRNQANRKLNIVCFIAKRSIKIHPEWLYVEENNKTVFVWSYCVSLVRKKGLCVCFYIWEFVLSFAYPFTFSLSLCICLINLIFMYTSMYLFIHTFKCFIVSIMCPNFSIMCVLCGYLPLTYVCDCEINFSLNFLCIHCS